MDLAALLTDTRDLRATYLTDPVWQQVAEGTMSKLSPNHVIASETYRRLPWFHQNTLRAATAGLSATRSLVISRSAARLHGLWVIGRPREPVEMTLLSGHSRPSPPPGVIYRRLRLRAEDTARVHGVPVTSLARSAADVARYHGWEEGLVVFDSLLRRTAMPGQDAQRLARYLEGLGPLKGIAFARAALSHASPLSESPYESLARAQLLAAQRRHPQIRSVQLQRQIDLEDTFRSTHGLHRTVARVDLLVNDRVVVEVDGESKYDGTFGDDPNAVVVDERKREKRLHNLGYLVLRVSPREITANELVPWVVRATSRP